MSKLVSEVFSAVKGEDKINDTLTGRGSFSKTGFGDVVNALVNDSSYTIDTYNKNGEKDGSLNISEVWRKDIEKTLDKLGWPSKAEAKMVESCEIITKGIASTLPYIFEEWLKCGRKFELPIDKKFVGAVYLAEVPGKTKTIDVFDPSTRQNLGTAEITTKDSIAVKTKSPVPSFLKTKIRKDTTGKIVK